MANCVECKKERAARAETDHSPEWVLSKELIKEIKRLRIHCASLLVINALLVLVMIFK